MTTLKELRQDYRDLGLGNPRKLSREALEDAIKRQVALVEALELDKQRQEDEVNRRKDSAERRKSGELDEGDRAWRPVVNLTEYLETRAKELKAKMDERFDRDPMGALSWSLDLFDSVADDRVAKDIMSYYEAGWDLDEALPYLTREALRTVNHGRSTSPTSNLMESSLARAWAKLLPRLTQKF